jgi:hypothetical protein
MENKTLELALKNPLNLSNSEIDEILSAQLQAVRYLKQFVAPESKEKKREKNRLKGRRSNLKNITNRV